MELTDAQRQHLPLRVLLGAATEVERQAQRYAAAAVYEAIGAGAGWETVAAAAGMETAQAYSRWSSAKVLRLFRPSPGENPELPAGQRRWAAERLGAALTQLQDCSQVSLLDAARQADLTPAFTTGVLSGEFMPPWPVVHMLASIFKGEPIELRALWECGQGRVLPSRLSAEGTAGYLAAALRGLHLAAGRPPLEQLAKGGLSATSVGRILSGHVIPDWPDTAHLVSVLGGRPGDLHGLWQEVHSAVLTLYGAFPPPCEPGPADIAVHHDGESV
ncbi:hypothetical protein ACFYNY_23510 [Streptomyces sp. NPDC006530]|uniref:hypothetical protein n=1 Tax=Streptomyces sp. NPDC006530 TaxID=3364750 RepID=UPI0036AA4131